VAPSVEWIAEQARRLGREVAPVEGARVLVMDEGAEGTYDYVIATLPAEGREAFLAKIAARLTPGGIGYIAHHVKPGWFGASLAREMAARHGREVLTPELSAELDGEEPPAMDPGWFIELATLLPAAGLRFLGDAEPEPKLDPSARVQLAALPDRLEREQLVDYLANRRRRQTLVVRA
jgi:hypothetical protein